MRRLITRSRESQDKRRGTAMIEMIFVLPIMLILIGFVVDLGMAVYTKNALSDATQASVRVASQRGGAVIGGQNVARDHFYASVDTLPGLDRTKVLSYTAGPATCTNTNSTVQATAQYQHDFIMPGLNALFNMIGGDGVGDGFQLSAASTLRCEIAWQ